LPVSFLETVQQWKNFKKPQIIFRVIKNKIESTAFILCLPQQTQNVMNKKAVEDNKEG
jgi:hypothetical protein